MMAMRQHYNSERERLAQELGISPDDLDGLADDYRYRVMNAGKKAVGNLPVKMHKIPPKILERYKAAFARQQAEAAASMANPPHEKLWNEADLPKRQAILDKAGVKHSPKLDWAKHTKAVKSKIAAVMNEEAAQSQSKTDEEGQAAASPLAAKPEARPQSGDQSLSHAQRWAKMPLDERKIVQARAGVKLPVKMGWDKHNDIVRGKLTKAMDDLAAEQAQAAKQDKAAAKEAVQSNNSQKDRQAKAAQKPSDQEQDASQSNNSQKEKNDDKNANKNLSKTEAKKEKTQQQEEPTSRTADQEQGLEAAGRKGAPPRKKRVADARKLWRSNFDKKLVLPDDLHARLFDYGHHRSVRRSLFGAAATQEKSEDLWRKKLARKLKISPDSLDSLADDYHAHIRSVSSNADAPYVIKLDALSPQRLEQLQVAFKAAKPRPSKMRQEQPSDDSATAITPTAQQLEAQAVASMRRVLATKADVENAVTRPDIGQIDFVWGSEGGAIDGKGKRKGAYGVAHILEARQRKDGLTQEQAEKVAEEVARVVAVGDIVKDETRGDGNRKITITNNSFEAALAKTGDNNSWLLTGYEIWESKKGSDEIVKGRDNSEPTHFKPTPTRPEVGAEPDVSTAQDGADVKTVGQETGEAENEASNETGTVKQSTKRLEKVKDGQEHNKSVKFSIKDKSQATGPFGPILDGFRGDAAGAIAALREIQDGEAVAALNHKDIGDIDLIWGEAGSGNSDGYGLAKLVKYHPEVLDHLQEILDEMEVVSRSDNRINLESTTHKAGIRLAWDGKRKTWLLTAFGKGAADTTMNTVSSKGMDNRHSSTKGATSTTTDTAGSKGAGDTARYSSTLDDRITQRISDFYSKDKQAQSKGTIASVTRELHEGEVGQFTKALMDNGKLRLIETATHADNVPDGVQGWTSDDGTITLVADTIQRGEAQSVLLHEMFHSGVHPLIGDAAWGKLMRQLNALYNQFENPGHKGANAFFKAAQARVARAQKLQGEMLPQISAEEFAAYAVEEYARAPKAAQGFVDNLIGRIKAWGLRVFGKQFGQVTPAQLHALAKAALKAQANETGGTYPARLRFSLGNGLYVLTPKDMRQAGTFDEARQAAKEFQGKVLTNRQSGLEATVSRNNLDKMLSRSAVKKSESAAAHSFAVANLDKLFERAIYGWRKDDAKGQGGIDGIHRLFAPLALSDGRVLLSKLTVKETVRPDQRNTLYTVEAVDINEESPASKWVESEITADKLARMSILYAGDTPSVAQEKYKNNSDAVMRLAEQIEQHNALVGKRDKSKKYSISSTAASTVTQLTPARIKQEVSGLLTDKRSMLLKTVPLNYFTELAPDNMTAVKGYLDIKRKLDAYRGAKHAQADAIAQKWRKLSKFGRDKMVRLADLMHESTLAGIDPSKTDAETKAKQGYQTLRNKWNNLPPLAQELYIEVRDAYKAQAQELDQIILDNVEKVEKIAQEKLKAEFEQEKARIEKLSIDLASKRAQIEALEKAYNSKRQRGEWGMKARLMRLRQAFEKSRIEEPYFPLARFGQYYVTVKDRSGEVISFSRREKASTRDRLAAEMKAAYPDAQIEVGLLANSDSYREQMDPRMLAEIDMILGNSGLSREENSTLMDEIWQRYLSLMPDQSIRKRFIHRKGTAGFDADALRAFASHMFHAAHQMGRLKFGIDLQEQANQATEQAKVADDPTKAMFLANELRDRHGWVMNPKGSKFAQTMNSTAFMWYLAVRPSAAIVNMTQTPMMGIPILGAKLGGFGKATMALLKASRDSIAGRGNVGQSPNLTMEEQQAMEAFYESGLIDRTQSHDLAGVGETGVEYSPLRSAVMQKMSFLFHRAEVWNREVTALAAYRMARAQGQDVKAAIDTAHDLTWKTHFDYSNSSRPKILQGDAMKMIMVFRNHNINMIYRLARDVHQSFKGATPQARREAQKQLAGILGMMALFGGTTGVFGFSIAMTILGAIFGDSDDPFDFERRFRDNVVDMMGPELGGIVLNGAPGHYLGIDLTNRIGMPDIWLRSPSRDLQGKDEWQYYVMNMAGASVSMLGEMWRGADLISDGNVARGVEAMVPKWAADIMKTARYNAQGLTNLRGDEILPQSEIDGWDLIAQALGFTPAKIVETYERNNALKNAETRLLNKRRQLMNAYALAVAQKDSAARLASRDEQCHTLSPLSKTHLVEN